MSLYPTPTRKALVRRVHEHPKAIYFEAGQVWDFISGGRVTSRMKEVVSAGWLRVAEDNERPEGALSGRKYYVATDEGRRIIQKGQPT